MIEVEVKAEINSFKEMETKLEKLGAKKKQKRNPRGHLLCKSYC